MKFHVTLHFIIVTMGWVCASAETPLPRPPNILVAVADDWSFGHAGAYGSRWVKTPAFDRIAKNGILFTRAYTPNAKCSPSRAAMLTGRYPWLLGAAANHNPIFPPAFQTYPEALAKHGYFVGMTTKGWSPGIALDADGSPRNMAGIPFDSAKLTPPTSGIFPNDYAANFSEFLEAAPAGQPWCFWYGSAEPHRNYEAGSGIAKGGKSQSDIDRVPGFWPDNPSVRIDMLDYALEVEHFDLHLGRMLDQLAAAGMLENTLVIVTSDNGMPFPRIKGQTYDLSNHIPLAISWPAGIVNPNRTEPSLVSLIDLAPTFLELAKLAPAATSMAPFSGRSLTDLFTEKPIGPPRDHVLLGRERNDVGRPMDQGYPVRGIVRDQWLYLHNFQPDRWPGGNPETGYMDSDGSPTKTEVLQSRTTGETRFWQACFGKRPNEELYNIDRDPDCLENLASHAVGIPITLSLKKSLFEYLTNQQDPRMTSEGDPFDAYPYAPESLRGFYERYMSGERPTTGWIRPTDYETAPLEGN